MILCPLLPAFFSKFPIILLNIVIFSFPLSFLSFSSFLSAHAFFSWYFFPIRPYLFPPPRGGGGGGFPIYRPLLSPFYWQILQKTIFFYDFKNTSKISAKQETRVYSWIGFCRMEKRGQKTRQKLTPEKTRVFAQKPWLKMLFKNWLSGYMVPGERPGVWGKVGGNVLHDSQPLVGRALHNHLRGLQQGASNNQLINHFSRSRHTRTRTKTHALFVTGNP